jgi:SAM-dependent methyltransferase
MDVPFSRYQKARIAHWDTVACELDHWTGLGGYYHRRLAQVYRFLVAPGQRVLELGCAMGDLLAALKPSFGLGVELSGEMVKRAARRHPEIHFIRADAHDFCLDGTFDVIVLSDLVNDLWDVQTVFQQIACLSHGRTRVILNTYSRLWELPLAAAEGMRLARPQLFQNWLTVEDVRGLLGLADFEIIRVWQEILWPLPTPLLDAFFNRFLVKIWPFSLGALSNFVIARPVPRQKSRGDDPLVSVVVPARNEAGNIAAIFERTPELGRGTELVFVEGHSRDNTYAAIEQLIADRPERRCKLLRQTGVGKGDAVRLGFAHASGDILLILDADLTMPPESLPRFYDALQAGKADFANGVRLVYPMEEQAMRFLNLVANKSFGLAFSWLLGQAVKDTLCGTKGLWRTDYELIAANRKYFGDFDPFGDFDLLFGAARLGLRIVDVPIRYRERTYGTTNIQRWTHGWLLLRMVLFAAFRIKFV